MEVSRIERGALLVLNQVEQLMECSLELFELLNSLCLQFTFEHDYVALDGARLGGFLNRVEG